MSQAIVPWRCSICKAPLESVIGKLFPISVLRGPAGEVCKVCHYRVCSRCLATDERGRKRHGLCRECASHGEAHNSEPQQNVVQEAAAR